jgi:hypothetical protein
MDKNQKGCFAEYKFATMAMERGFNVSMPLLDASTYDCILEKNGNVFKVQVKYVGHDRKESPYTSGRNTYRVTLARTQQFYPKHLCDYFAVWVDSYNGFFIVKNDEQTAIRLSLSNKYAENFNNFNIIL